MTDVYVAPHSKSTKPGPAKEVKVDKEIKQPKENKDGDEVPDVLADLEVLAKHPEVRHAVRGHSHSPLSSYSYLPDGTDFETHDSVENIVLMIRRHPVTNIPWIVVALLMTVAPLIVVVLPTIPIPYKLQLVVVLGWYLITTAYILENFLNWFFNINVITDEKIVDIDFYNLVGKHIADCRIDKIEDVSYTMHGVIRTMFNYGDVFVQTAAEVTNFEMLAVPHPDRVVKILSALQVQEEQEKLEGRVR